MPIHCYTDDHRYAIEGPLDTDFVPCRHVRLGTTHRLKLASSNSKSARERLVHEGQVQARLAHPHIEAVTDVVEVEGRAGLILEAGEPAVLSGRTDVGALASGLLSAVAFMHEQGWVHRDIHPRNVQVCHRVPKWTHFGSAKAVGADGRAVLTRGTPGYLAPERLKTEAVAPTEDVFSLGVMLYELVCGRQPFEGKEPSAVLKKRAGELVDPKHWAPDSPEPWRRAIVGALQVDPAKRIKDGGELWKVWSA